MNLKVLVKNLDIISAEGGLEKDITSIAYNHGQVCSGALFVAVKGGVSDGHKFIGDAFKRGALAVVCEEKAVVPEGKTLISVSDSRVALASLSAIFFGEPSKKISLIGITGTNGKTTITYLLESIFREAGFKPGVIGTIEHRFASNKIVSVNTTPESYDLQKLLADMLFSGVDACAMEVSSHALSLKRVVDCHFNGVVFTNLTPEHLDFHGHMEDYFEAKKRLFNDYLKSSSKRNKFAAVNIDDPYGEKIIKGIKQKVMTYSVKAKSDVLAESISYSTEGTLIVANTPSGKVKCFSKLAGQFNVSNVLAAVSVGIGLGMPLDKIVSGIEKLSCVPGRFERVENKKGITAFVDYAHTPDALENVLTHAKNLLPDKADLIVVFGCGGDRDKNKRPLMGDVASRIASRVIVTSDNPRTEDPKTIIDEIVSGVKEKNYEIIVDRKAAIESAVNSAREGDIIIVAGKGHEDYQIIGKVKKHFDDREVLKSVLST